MRKFIHNYIHCGLLGWFLEITFTAFQAFRRRDFKLPGATSVWMFPIYGMASFLKPVCRLIRRFPTGIRAACYSIFIFLGEYVSGSLLKKYQICPWDYSKARANINGVIRLDYAPVWMIAGLIFEKLLMRPKQDPLTR